MDPLVEAYITFITAILNTLGLKFKNYNGQPSLIGKEIRIYISIFPSFVIKYNKVSADSIKYISNNCRKVEDIFTVINDPECILSSEDLLHKACQKVNDACIQRNYASILNTKFTEVYEVPISFPELLDEINNYRYAANFELYQTGKIFTGETTEFGVLAILNKIFKFLRQV